ncbi:MAG: hypothetical protein C3F11_01605 [Methylocystaceae bacterium]|nr:MAG: hypothetical protein C3F11_01605 [Methylocystaceae bacterium]
MRHVSKTSIVKAVEDAVNYARTMRRAAAVTGAPGIGKSTALQSISDADPSAILIYVGGARRTDRAFARLLADSIGIVTGAESTAKLWDIAESILSHPQFGNILLFDEAQNIPLALLKEVVDFPSRFGVPVVVCGNAELLKRQRVASAAFDQVSSRIAKRVVLNAPTPEDFQTIGVDFDVFGKDAHAACVDFGLNTSIRELVQVLESARVYAGDGPLRLQEIKRAVAWIKGAHALKLLSRAA